VSRSASTVSSLLGVGLATPMLDTLTFYFRSTRRPDPPGISHLGQRAAHGRAYESRDRDGKRIDVFRYLALVGELIGN